MNTIKQFNIAKSSTRRWLCIIVITLITKDRLNIKYCVINVYEFIKSMVFNYTKA